MTKDEYGAPRLLYECSTFLLMYKPHGLATVPLKKQTETAGSCDTLLNHAAKVDAKVLNVHGRNPWEGGALHRLDTATAGIVMFAKDQGFYDLMQQRQSNGMFEKYYTATTICNDALKGVDLDGKKPTSIISSYFRPYGVGARQVRPTLDERRAEPKVVYTTLVSGCTSLKTEWYEYNDQDREGGSLGCNDHYTCNGHDASRIANCRAENHAAYCTTPHQITYRCTIGKGFRHQIRAHLAWTGHPIVGDLLYGGSSNAGEELELTCVGISFQDMENGRRCPRTFMMEGFSAEDFPHTQCFGPWFAKNGDDGIIAL